VLRSVADTSEPLTIHKTEIKSRALSKSSNMPTGMLNTLEKGQVLDLIAYLIADGETNAVAFKKP